ncbi:uncharacterized protein EDB91DRAFT_1240203 [Suillus paluster]|uniref:uncharacterized protein n=1 Tax=Suillus paluster TaxID=48578 RepID=UPI001B8643E6|nr:uncharacterized protein EDB91DRAFT_1240203 [Suillus paluster]KAG1722596.1 hypothetical protein EDB91DRAFT_1240203 [Suillus paluster]
MAGAGGRPSKKPRLVRHPVPGSAGQSSQNVHRHRVFAIQPTGQINLETRYLDAVLPVDNVSETHDVSADCCKTDPWNETYISLDAEPHEIYVLTEKQKQMVKDCFSVDLFCRLCMIKFHQNVPLHRVKQWQDRYFHPTTLKHLGLHIQLGDHTGQSCCNPKPAREDDFVVIDVHGIHEVALDFCSCANAPSHYRQLLRGHFFPSTSTDPRTAATFAVLEHFHLLSFESKVSAYEFYHCLACQSDNTGIKPIKDRYSVFLRIMRQWQNLTSLKRSGRGHDPAGVDAMQQGQLAVLCPACPQLGKNVPEDLAHVSSNERWLYSLFLAIDANFHLKHRLVSNNIKDPGLSPGWGYFVEEGQYKTYLCDHADVRQEKSMCVSHNAINMADTKLSKGLVATSVGSVVCARHDMQLASGVGDLQRGEKYMNMDYIVFSALSAFASTPICVSTLPSQLQPNRVHTAFNFFVLKFHIAAHIAACQTNFSFNWTPGVGRTDGEAPERGWADINRITASTKEMGPSSCREVLDDHFGNWNWKKVTAFGCVLLHKIKEAIKAKTEHCHALTELEESIKQSDLGVASLTNWTNEVLAWELDHSNPNPFESRVTATMQAAVHLELLMQDAQDLEDRSSVSLHSDVTPSILISTGLDIEHAHLGQHATNEQQTKILACSNSLQCCIEAWTKIQVLYMPSVSQLRATNATGHNRMPSDDEESGCPRPRPNSVKPEDFQLLFPSDICSYALCDPKLLHIEWSLHFAQANDALDECRSHIHLCHQLLHFKGQHLRGQCTNTRVRKTIQAVDDWLVLSHDKYLCAHSALVCLSRHIDHVRWDRGLQPLKKTNLRPIGDLGGQTLGTAIMPWIWLTHGISSHDSKGLQDTLCVEWCKARARHNWWEEEIQLLLVEMQRVLAFLAWEARQWDERATLHMVEWSEYAEGLIAYANRQGAIHHGLSASFSGMWRDVGALKMLNLLNLDIGRASAVKVTNVPALGWKIDG